MQTKKFAVIIFAILLLAVGVSLYFSSQKVIIVDDINSENASTSTSEVINEDSTGKGEVPEGKIRADMFVGNLEEVNVGCFADGECYVVVDGKHVTVLMGWTQAVVGTVQGVEGIGDLESHIGEKVQVYAQMNADGTYTLYGSEGFYVKLISGVSESGGSEGIAVGEPNPSTPPSSGDEAKPQIVRDGCMVGGCSSEMCGEAKDMEGMASTCEYAAHYACYQVATCERQTSGKCGWTETPELNQCLVDMKNQPVLLEN